MKNRSLFKSREFSIASMLSALTVVLSFLEGMLPELPVPGAKLGLANLAVMTAIDILGIKGAVCTVLVKSFFAAVTRGPAAGIMSFCGSMLSAAAMWLFLRYDKNMFGYVGIGVIGAVGHNTGQLCASFAIMGSAVLYYAPFLVVSAVLTGTFTGIINSILLPAIKKSEKYNIS